MASLFVIQGRDQGRRFELVDSVLRFGREAGNDVQLRDSEVSRRHAEFRREGDNIVVVDLGSSNGTYVNDQPAQRHELRSGDRIQLGRTLMIFTDDEPVEDLTGIIDISEPSDRSHIVRSLGHEEGSRILLGDEGSSPWLATARSNLEIMYHTALAVSHTLDIDQLLGRILELIFEWVEADRGCVMLVDYESGDLMPKARRKRIGSADEETIRISRTILDYVLEHKEGVITSDALEDDRWDAGGSIVQLGVREAICVPMQGRYGMVGVIYIDTYTAPSSVVPGQPSRRFTEEHLKLMIAIGHQAALAVEDTSYYSAMVQAERLAAVGQTIAVLSHHIKNILQGIRGGSYLIEEGLKCDEHDIVRKGWAIVEKNQEKISHLVLDMLTFSKERKPEMAPADLNQVTADVIELMQTRASDGKIELLWHPSTEMPKLSFDAEAMHRAILNVVSNAIDACHDVEQGRVEVSTELDVDAGILRVVVEDTGEGIEPEDLSRIFTVFESRKGNRGTGLGLPVSQKILNEHGGDILVSSTLGEGSRFVLELPAVAIDTSPSPLTGTNIRFEPEPQ